MPCLVPCSRRGIPRGKHMQIAALRTAVRIATLAAALAVTPGCFAGARAETFPSRPVTIIVPFPAGGPTDTLARILGERMKETLGQPIIIENVTGAGASIG